MPSPIPRKENRSHGTAEFPCAFYQADSHYTPSRFFVKHHWHEEMELIHFEKGHYHLEVNMDKYEISNECFCFINREELHALSCEEGYVETALVFSPRIISFSLDDPAQKGFIGPLTEGRLSLPRFITPGEACFPALKESYGQIQTLFAQEAHAVRGREQWFIEDPIRQLRLKICLLRILAALAESGALQPAQNSADRRIEMVKKTILYMQDHSAEKIYIRDLAGLVGMNEQYFCRFFKKMIGKSPIAYLNDLRLKHAVRLLLETDLSVTDICLECGFNNLGNFMRIFKNAYGVTPLQYRKSK